MINVVSGLLLALQAAGPGAGDLERHAFDRVEMGTRFRIVLYASSRASATQAAEAAFDRVRALNHILSDYEPQSELNRLCRTAGTGRRVAMSPELETVLTAAQQLSRQSNGNFDITIGPMVRLWRECRKTGHLPKDSVLAKARQSVGYRHLKISGGHAHLVVPGMSLDLGGIAKGYAADEALRVLRKHGIQRALVDAGGDIVLGDPPPGRDGWRIGVAPLGSPDGKPAHHLVIANTAVATSGDAYRVFVVGGTRYSHIIDPKTGLGITRPRQVTVIARTGMIADGIASAVSVLGPTKGMPLVEQSETAAAIVTWVEDDGAPGCRVSKRFNALIRD